MRLWSQHVHFGKLSNLVCWGCNLVCFDVHHTVFFLTNHHWLHYNKWFTPLIWDVSSIKIFLNSLSPHPEFHPSLKYHIISVIRSSITVLVLHDDLVLVPLQPHFWFCFRVLLLLMLPDGYKQCCCCSQDAEGRMEWQSSFISCSWVCIIVVTMIWTTRTKEATKPLLRACRQIS